MKQFLMIQNDGKLDTRAITLIGASSKRGAAAAIGMFGSGFSYTVGTLLRRGLEFHIFSGEREVQVTTERETFRDIEVNVIHVDGDRTSLTAEIGPKWTEIECVREVWSNAVDEGGAVRDIVAQQDIHGYAAQTSVYIEISPAIQIMLDNWQHFFIDQDEVPLFENKAGKIFPVTISRPARYFRRGVWCTEDKNMPPNFVYDIFDLDLPESRQTTTDTARWGIGEVLSYCDKTEILLPLLEKAKTTHVIEFDMIYAGQQAATGLKELLIQAGKQFIGDQTLRGHVTKDLEAVTFWCFSPKNVKELQHLTSLKDVMTAVVPEKPYKKRSANQGEDWRVSQMVMALCKAGIPVNEFPIFYGSMRDPNHLAVADLQDNCMVLSEAATRDNNTLFKALVEEYIHLKFRCADHTAEQQHAYLQLIRQAVDKVNE